VKPSKHHHLPGTAGGKSGRLGHPQLLPRNKSRQPGKAAAAEAASAPRTSRRPAVAGRSQPAARPRGRRGDRQQAGWQSAHCHWPFAPTVCKSHAAVRGHGKRPREISLAQCISADAPAEPGSWEYGALEEHCCVRTSLRHWATFSLRLSEPSWSKRLDNPWVICS